MHDAVVRDMLLRGSAQGCDDSSQNMAAKLKSIDEREEAELLELTDEVYIGFYELEAEVEPQADAAAQVEPAAEKGKDSVLRSSLGGISIPHAHVGPD